MARDGAQRRASGSIIFGSADAARGVVKLRSVSIGRHADIRVRSGLHPCGVRAEDVHQTLKSKGIAAVRCCTFLQEPASVRWQGKAGIFNPSVDFISRD